MSSRQYRHYHEIFPGDLNLQHKITPETEKTTFHLHSHMELLYTVSDNLIFYSENHVTRLKPGSLLLLDSMCLHYIGFLPTGKACDRYVLYFNPNLILNMNIPEVNLLDCFVRQKGSGMILLPSATEQKSIRASLDNMLACFEEQTVSLPGDASSLPPMDRMFMRLELGKLLLLANRIVLRTQGAPQTASYQAHSQTVSEVCHFIDDHFAEPLCTEQIARQFLMSKTLLYNLFKEVMHFSVMDYLSSVRINQAKSMLLNTTYSVEIISQKVGYDNISSFSRVFKNKVGMGPLQYRKKRSTQ